MSLLRGTVQGLRAGKVFSSKGVQSVIHSFNCGDQTFRVKTTPGVNIVSEGDNVNFQYSIERWGDGSKPVNVVQPESVQVLSKNPNAPLEIPQSPSFPKANTATYRPNNSSSTYSAAKTPTATEVRQWAVNQAINYLVASKTVPQDEVSVLELADRFVQYAQTGTKPLPIDAGALDEHI